MEEQFVPFELSIKLEELGFKENVLATYFKDGYFLHIPYDISLDKLKNVRAPLWQQAFDWFRIEKRLKGSYNITCFKTNYSEESYGYNVTALDGKNKYLSSVRMLKTYEEARLKCLEKLIELVEQKKDSV